MRDCTVVSSLTSKKGMTQAGLAYLCTALTRSQCSFRIIDLSGKVSYFDPPEEIYSICDSLEWMNPDSIIYGDWMDYYLPSTSRSGDLVFFSSLFSPDILFHARYSYKIKISNLKAITAIGGCALTGLHKEQLELIANFFDYVLIGHDVEKLLKFVFHNKRSEGSHGVIAKEITPPGFSADYSLLPLDDFVTVYTGHGCYYGKCRFCDYPVRAHHKTVFRSSSDIAKDVHRIYQLHPNVGDIVLSQDSYTEKHLHEIINDIEQYGNFAPYNLMLRAEPWVSQTIGEKLGRSGCTDVFIGAEAFDDEILKTLNKGVTSNDIINAVKTLSEYIYVTIGLILFVPGVSEVALHSQLRCLEKLLPYIYSIEPEVLTIVNGSEFARNPSQYGIILHAKENLLNDSWCFGLSQDIPWTMTDSQLMKRWFMHTDKLRDLCYEYVKQEYWDAIEFLR